MAFDTQQGLSMGMTGAATGAVVGGPIGAAVGGVAGLAMGGFMGGKSGPNMSGVKTQYEQRSAQIGQFAASLGAARAKYLTSLNNMYNSAYSRFSGNAEAGFASRGLAVNGGAFASALAKKSAEFQAELEPLAFTAEREDLYKVDQAYGVNSSAYMGALNGSAAMGYQGDREDMRSMGSFAGQLALRSMGPSSGREYGSGGGANGYGVENPSAYPRNSFRGNPLDLRN